MKTGSVREVIEAIKHARIGVLGDFCLDAYWFVDEAGSEISIETGLTTRTVRQQKYSLGGAGNVAANLAAMEIKDIRVFGVIGNDAFGAEMVRLMKEAGIGTDNLIIQDQEWATHVYVKPISGDNEGSRIDFGNFNKLSEDSADKLIKNLSDSLNSLDLVIINQQVLSGIHTDYFRSKLTEVISRNGDKTFIADSRNYAGSFTGALRKMNDVEASQQCGIEKKPGDMVSSDEIKKVAEELYKRYGKPLFITRGSRGSLTIDDKGIIFIPGLMILSKTDTVGAGDSYLAGASAALAAGYNTRTAAELGNFAAGVTVRKLYQTGTASPEEIIAIGQDPDYIFDPEIAEDPRHAHYHDNTDIEIVTSLKSDLNIRHAIFDNDGTVSTLREGWELIMSPMMLRAVLGKRYGDADEATFCKVKERVDEFIDKTTGIQTLMQMKILLDLIREFGFVAEDEMLDEHGYKEIYNYDLMQMVKKREGKLLRGELTPEDLTIKGSIPFLKKLYDTGIRLYLTSGTDEEDVKHEASVLGYDHLFEGRIYGATGDIRKEAKRILLERIIGNIGISEAKTIVTFGDGPVEIREARKRGGFSTGVASNELRRHGLNIAKRERLIKAGADIIVPDFSQADHLLKLLNIR
ncbi:MAG: hypothetical protein K0B05_04025 [Bacteroidales bacterium]|nr:hypothetical protein [Bacteroidales bacterium]